MRAFSLLLLLVLSITSITALKLSSSVPTTVFSKTDATRVQKYLTSLQHKDGTFGDAQTTAYATSTLVSLSATIPKSKEVCASATAALKDTKDIIIATSSIITLVSSKCDVKLSTATKTLLQQGLTSKSLETIYHSTQAVIALVKAKHATVGDFDLSTVSKTVISLLEDDGTYRSTTDLDSDATAYHAGMALSILGDIFASAPEMEETSRAAIRQATTKIADLIKLGGESVDYTYGTNDLSQLYTASVVVRGIITFANAVSEAVEVTDSHINRFANLFLLNQYTQDITELYSTITALHAIANNNIYIPIVLSVTEATPSSLRVRVTNVVDDATSIKLGVTATSIVGSDSQSILSDVTLTSSDDVVFTLPSNTAWSKVEPGFITFKFKLDSKNAGERYKLNEIIVRTSKIVTEVTGGEVSVVVSEAAKTTDADQVVRASHPSALSSPLTVDASKYLHLKISLVSKIKPSQVFVQLVNHDSKTAVFVAKYGKDGKYAVKLNFGSSEVTEALYGAGDYSLYILVGDSLLSSGLRWKIGIVKATIPDTTSHDSTVEFQSKPEIHHIFRQPDSRPSKFVAFIFSLLVLTPLVGLVMALLHLGVRISLPSNPSEFLSALIFQGSIGAILILYVFYWLHLNIFQALIGAGVLGVVAIFSGNSALRALHVRTAGGKRGKAQ